LTDPLQVRYPVIKVSWVPSFPWNVSPLQRPRPVGSTIGCLWICDTAVPVTRVRFPPAWKDSFSVHGSMLRVGYPNVTFAWPGNDLSEVRNAVWRWG
jgi:hypothetical protein